MLSDMELLARLALAAVLGSVVGLERERLRWAAGLRTHMLVCVGACLIMIVSAFGFSGVQNESHVVLDPSRVAAQVVSGIGFLGAGTILLRGDVVRGLTTAAGLWSVAAIGLAVGGGLYLAALATTVLILAILAGIKPLEARFRLGLAERSITLTAHRNSVTFDMVSGVAAAHASRIKRFVLQPDTEDDTDVVVVSFERLSRRAVDDVAKKLGHIDGVEHVIVAERENET